jgi:poly-gamma-glutamate capsule biosynthesis protein CapA/YwtB (metallophosphatase superfamily)
VHWGTELATCPDETQLRLARAFVDAGADVVVGHHPHVLQGIEIVDGAVIAYSMGNFAFSGSFPETRRSGVLQVELGELPAARIAPVTIAPGGIPFPADEVEAAAILALVDDRSPGGAAGCGGIAAGS